MAARKLRLEEQKIARSEKLAQERVARKNFMKIKKEAEKEEKVRQQNEKLEQRKMEKQEAIASLIKVKVKLVKRIRLSAIKQSGIITWMEILSASPLSNRY